MKFQLHWQKRMAPSETLFIAQGEFTNARDLNEWARFIFEANQEHKPEGWHPMVCDESSPYFLPGKS